MTAPSLLRIESKWLCTVRGLIESLLPMSSPDSPAADSFRHWSSRGLRRRPCKYGGTNSFRTPVTDVEVALEHQHAEIAGNVQLADVVEHMD